MRKILLTGFAISLILVALFTFNKINSYTFKIISPLPSFFSANFAGFGRDDLWKPTTRNFVSSKIKKPNFAATSVLSYDLTTNTFLFSQDINRRVPLASLTKIMTAIIALENGKTSDIHTVSKKAANIGENSMGLGEGEKLRLEDLLFGLILLSGNDAAEVIAENSKFGRDNFVYIMNKKAEDLGLTDTHFTNPSGLEGDGNQYSSAYDLLVMTRYGLENSDFSRIVSTVNYDIPKTDNHKEYTLFNETNLLTSYPGVKGVKTGYTYEAGLCLVTYLEYQGHKIIGVLLNAENRRQEMKELLDYSLKVQGIKPPPHS